MGVSIASRLGITAAIAVIVAALLGGGYWWVKSNGPRDTVKDKPTGVKVEMEALSFYGKKDTKVVGKVYRQADVADNERPAVIYIQDVSYGEGWCRSIAATGAVCYAFDFQTEGERERAKELEAVLKGIKGLRYVDSGRIYLLGEGNGCVAACNAAFNNPKKVKGLIEKQKERGWDFLFLGANIDVAEEAERFGIERDNAVAYDCDSVGIRDMYCKVSNRMCFAREKGRFKGE